MSQPRQLKFDLKPPDSRGYSLGTLIGGRKHKPTVTPTIEDQQQLGEDGGGEQHSPGAGSAPPSPSPFENGVSSPDKKKTFSNSMNRGRTISQPGILPPRLPPKSSPSMSNIRAPPIPDRNSHSPPVFTPPGTFPRPGPKPGGERKPAYPPPPSPNNDKVRREKAPFPLPPPDFEDPPLNPVPLPPRVVPPVPERTDKQVVPPPPLPPRQK